MLVCGACTFLLEKEIWGGVPWLPLWSALCTVRIKGGFVFLNFCLFWDFVFCFFVGGRGSCRGSLRTITCGKGRFMVMINHDRWIWLKSTLWWTRRIYVYKVGVWRKRRKSESIIVLGRTRSRIMTQESVSVSGWAS